MTAVARMCPGPETAHRPTQKSYKDSNDRKYYLFKAAEDGCVACVRMLITEEGIDPHEQSNTCKYTALQFASWAVEQAKKKGRDDRGCAEVVKFLEQYRLLGVVARRATTPSGNSGDTALEEPPSQGMASASAAAWCLLCDRPKVDVHYICAAGKDMPEAPDLNARLRQAVLEECIVCVQELVTWRVNPTIQEPGIFGESPMSIATRKHHLAWSILQSFHTARMLEPYNSMPQDDLSEGNVYLVRRMSQDDPSEDDPL